MAGFSETIQLKDEVTGAAKSASASVLDLSKGMIAVTSTMNKAGASAKPIGSAMGDLSKKTFDAANAIAVG